MRRPCGSRRRASHRPRRVLTGNKSKRHCLKCPILRRKIEQAARDEVEHLPSHQLRDECSALGATVPRHNFSPLIPSHFCFKVMDDGEHPPLAGDALPKTGAASSLGAACILYATGALPSQAMVCMRKSINMKLKCLYSHVSSVISLDPESLHMLR